MANVSCRTRVRDDELILQILEKQLQLWLPYRYVKSDKTVK